MEFKYDYLIVGSGLFGATFAHEAKKAGKKVLVIDKRPHLGGNVYCEKVEGINVHKYGAHIFHTNDKKIWNYVNSFCEFNNFINSPIANYKGKLFNLPFNMNTFYQMWGTITPEQAQSKIEEQKQKAGVSTPSNLEEQAISMVGTDIYEALIKGYTAKQWGRDPKDLPAWIIKRLPLRFTFNNNYFNDLYQGIPVGGYNSIITGMLEGVETQLNVDFFKERGHWESVAEKIVYTGKIDELFNFQFGELSYRSLNFEQKVLDQKNFQGSAVVNYTDSDTPFTRILEHKHFEFGTQDKTVITHEYPLEAAKGVEPYYPINDEANNNLYNKYRQLSETLSGKYLLGGRLAEYKYYDMHQVIGSALQKAKAELKC